MFTFLNLREHNSLFTNLSGDISLIDGDVPVVAHVTHTHTSRFISNERESFF